MASRRREGGWAACAAGAAAVAIVVLGRLSTASYRADLVTVCDAEAVSRLSVRTDMAGVSERVRAKLTTAAGSRFFSALRDAPLEDRAALLEREAQAAGLRGCPMVATYRQLTAEADYRLDVQRLCSYVTFPGLALLDDGARVRMLSAWLAEGATSARARFLANALRQTSNGAEAAILLCSAADEIGVLACDTAKVLGEMP